MDSLYTVDVWLFYAVNHGWSNGVLDTLMPIVTSSNYWRPVYIAGILALLVWGGARGRWCAAALLVTVAIVDPASHHLLKEPIQRLRPYLVLGDVHQLAGSGGGSFPSNHALNNAAAAMVLSWFYPHRRILWWSIAVIVALSRIYVGVHYPSDVLGGFVMGILAGWAMIAVVRRVNVAVPERLRFTPAA